MTIQGIRNEFKKAGRESDFENSGLEDSLRNTVANRTGGSGPASNAYEELVSQQEFNFTSLADIWNDTDITVPRRIRCAVHLLCLMGVLDFISRRQKDFWAQISHATFKSKF